jgi:hypothetical protein
MLIFGLDRGVLAEIDPDHLTHYLFTIQNLSDPNSGLLV